MSSEDDGGGELSALLQPRPAHGPARAAVLARIRAAGRIVLTTHVNADGDGTGCQAALAAWHEARGGRATIVNPTPFPEAFRFLLHRADLAPELEGPVAGEALREADLIVVVDTSEDKRLGTLRDRFRSDRMVVIDHHPAADREISDTVYREVEAGAAAEMVYDLLREAGGPWPEAAVQGVYTGIVTDTGSFRYSNTTARTHAIAADLLARGVDPEALYLRLFADVPLRRIRLLREALATMEHDPEAGISWMVITGAMTRAAGALPEDFEGILEHARSLRGTRVALLFRETPEGRTKLSFRSNGEVDVREIARLFGGGGHLKAAGAELPVGPAAAVRRVLAAVRERM